MISYQIMYMCDLIPRGRSRRGAGTQPHCPDLPRSPDTQSRGCWYWHKRERRRRRRADGRAGSQRWAGLTDARMEVREGKRKKNKTSKSILYDVLYVLMYICVCLTCAGAGSGQRATRSTRQQSQLHQLIRVIRKLLVISFEKESSEITAREPSGI